MRRRATTLLLTLLGVVLAGCGGQDPGGQDGRQLTLAAPRDLVAGPQDPYFTHQTLRVWEPLVTVDDRLRPVPALAVSWAGTEQGRRWTFTLRDGVKFSDGTALTAEAVVANVRRFLRIAPRQSAFFSLDAGMEAAYGKLRDVRAADGKVTFDLDEPVADLPSRLAGFFSMVQSPKAFTSSGDFAGKPVGTGPYTLVAWTKGQQAVLAANPHYHGAAPAYERIVVKVIPDANARVAALRAGEVDGLIDKGALLPGQVAAVAADSRFRVVRSPSVLTHYLTFNASREPFSDARLREAAELAIDRQAIVGTLLAGTARAGAGFLSPVFGDLADPGITARHDPGKARELVAAAGTPARPVSILISSAETGQFPYTDIAEVLRAALDKAGLPAKVTVAEATKSVMEAGDYDIFLSAYSVPNSDADYLFRRFLRSDASWNVERRLGYRSAGFDELVDRAAAQTDPAARRDLYHRVQRLLAADRPMIPLAYQDNPIVTTGKVGGVTQSVAYEVDLGELAPLR
ncbi:ABC transporter substrate-binding protein [Nonomuraea muscovyensis]|uniref:Peptide/nickel transport system substrate-binding protein n=1 Tax=Nonomuraea muscovyensis TaxID=1124761 RepID=A0A7X0F1T7_9ACTN|nr:ABC transporter substrate-binding protein [Nonomuraea muscovyensis]MBB6349969.1 peptide/nickel transport system substrate-binding protein [Nonomuraea muscovyensis]